MIVVFPLRALLSQGKQAQLGKVRDQHLNLTDWKPPTDSVDLTYRQWLDLALKHGNGGGGGEHWYFRVGDANNAVRQTVYYVLRSIMYFIWCNCNGSRAAAYPCHT